jgi:hypothetical protein
MKSVIGLAAAALVCSIGAASAQEEAMSFFVTSVNPGEGGNLGGLEGADAHCAALAEAVGVTGKVWAAYLSTSEVDARDRIGSGPWVNAEGVEIASDVVALHGDGNNVSKETALDETGAVVNGRGDAPNRHDILTGSLPNGTVAADQTCENWTSGGEETAGMLGHHDRMGLDDSEAARSWNSSHASRGGCGMAALQSTGGDGLFYCFATD